MKKIYLFAVAVAVSFALLQSVEARGTAHSFSSAPHFSASARSYSGPSRSYSSGASRYYSASRVSSMSSRSSFAARPRWSATSTAFRNPTYTSSPRRFAGDRTAAFNSRTFSRSSSRVAPANRSLASRSRTFNQGRVLARYSANNWHRNWDRGRDHFWHGHRCHFRNGFWFIYDPFLFYPYGYGYGYGYYPYDAYADGAYYDDSYASDQYAPDTANQSEYDTGSQVSNVQSALAREGYYDGAIDGTLGPATQKALRRFQRDHGLPVTGSVTRGVIQALRLR